MNDSVKKLQILAKAQSSLFRAQLKRVLVQVALLLVAGVFALLSLATLNVAFFEALDRSMGALKAGLIIGAVDLLIAIILAKIALSDSNPKEEEKLAAQISEMSLDSLSDDIDGARDELRGFLADVRRLRGFVTMLTSTIANPIATVVKILSGLSQSGLNTEETTESAEASES